MESKASPERSRRVPQKVLHQGTASTVALKDEFIRVANSSFVKGHGFSRAAKSNKSTPGW
jgi:hypothetical protein